MSAPTLSDTPHALLNVSFDLVRLIGEGGQGVVRLLQDPSDGTDVNAQRPD